MMYVASMKKCVRELNDLYHRHVYERPSRRYRQSIVGKVARDVPGFQGLAARLLETGLLIIPGHFSRQVDQFRAEFEPMVAKHAVSRGTTGDRDGFEDLGHLSVSSDGLYDAPALTKAAFDKTTTSLAAYYWGRHIYLAQATGTRLEPRRDVGDYRLMQWHHDAKNRQIKVMILLTDLERDDQRMDYLERTHVIWRGRADHGRRSPEEVAHYGSPVQCVGPAGTAIVFDTNGYHRGNRNDTVRRDVFTFSYTVG